MLEKRGMNVVLCSNYVNTKVFGSLVLLFICFSSGLTGFAETQNFSVEDSLIASFDFDEPESGIVGAEAKAEVQGTPVYVDAPHGKAAQLSETFWLKVKKENGEPLLKGQEEITISYNSKPDGGNGWVFYASNDEKTQTYQRERYIGIADKTSGITVERFNNAGSRPGNSLSAPSSTSWKHIDLVIKENSTTIFVDGVQKDTKDSTYKLSEILSETGGIIQLGKANWGSGEYYKGLIDDIRIYSRAFTNEEIEENYNKQSAPSISVDSGEVFNDQLISISHKIESAQIFYTLDGSEPTKEDKKYTKSFTIDSNTQIKAVAYIKEEPTDVATVDLTVRKWANTATPFRLQDNENVNNAKITWQSRKDSNRYEIYRNNEFIGTSSGDTLDDYDLAINQTYEYKVKAFRNDQFISESIPQRITTFTPTGEPVNWDNKKGGNNLKTPTGLFIDGKYYDYSIRTIKENDVVKGKAVYERVSPNGFDNWSEERELAFYDNPKVNFEGVNVVYNPETKKVVIAAHMKMREATLLQNYT